MRTVLLLAIAMIASGCLSPNAEPANEPAADTTSDDATLRAITETYTGTALGTPAAPFVAEHKFLVPTGAVGINGTLKFTAPVARFSLTLIDPYGETIETGYNEQTGVIRIATLDPPASGEWTWRVGATAAANTPYTLDAVAELIVPQNNLVRRTATINGQTFAEINVIMEENATFNFTFTASAPIHWDIHSHPPSGIKYWDEGTDTEKTGSFTAPARGIYSLLFENENPLATDITYEMTGAYRLHSHAQ